MYCEEKLIDGVTHCRSDPEGEWEPYTLQEISMRYEKMKRRVVLLAEEVDRLQKVESRIIDPRLVMGR